MLGIKSLTRVLSNIADLITRTKGLNDVHDDLGTHETSQGTHRTALGTHETAQGTHRTALGTHETSQATHRGALTTHEASQATHRGALGTHDTDIKTLLAALALEASLGTHDTDIKNLLATIAGYIDAEVAALITSLGRTLYSMDFWSDPQEEVQVAQAAGTLVITPTVTVADLPAGATIVRAIAMFKFRMVENIYAGVNKLDGATDPLTSQVIQVKETAAGAYIDAINFVDDQFTLADTAREGGDVLIGSIDIAAQVDGNDSYTFQWLLRKADQDFINFNDVQVGLRIYYSV